MIKYRLKYKLNIFFTVLLILGISSCNVISYPIIENEEKSTTRDGDLNAGSYESGVGFGLTQEEISTLQSLKKVDDYPLYTMDFYVESRTSSNDFLEYVTYIPKSKIKCSCSLFFVSADPWNLLYGRNFDWEYSPALLLFTQVPGRYSSVSMVDLIYFGFSSDHLDKLDQLPINELIPLLDTPRMPFDGMNEEGLVVGMAAVPTGDSSLDPQKPTLGSIGVIRKLLDYSSKVDEAIQLMAEYNIDFGTGPPIHYLIADKHGDSVVVEINKGEMYLTPNSNPWHLATNFIIHSGTEENISRCWRYDRINQVLSDRGGYLTYWRALDLLEDVSQNNTQWSVVYNNRTGKVGVVMGRQYNEVHEFMLSDSPE